MLVIVAITYFRRARLALRRTAIPPTSVKAG
jgi:hypothetical protein